MTEYIQSRAMSRCRDKQPKRKKMGAGIVFALIVLAAVFVVLRVGGVIGGSGAVRVSTENIRLDYSVDLELLAQQIADFGGSFSACQEDMDKLETAAAQNGDYAQLIEFFMSHMSAYSQTAVNTIILSPEKTAFVLLEPFVREPGSDEGVNVRKGKTPYFLQYDSRWGFAEYGSGVIGYTACGPTCLAMAAAGITGNDIYTPLYMSSFAQDNGYYVSGTGTAWSLFDEGAARLGLRGETISLNEFDMYKRLLHGEVIIASMSSGDFTYNGHFIVIYGYSYGAFKVYDPSSIERSSRGWTVEQLEGQVAQLWSISDS